LSANCQHLLTSHQLPRQWHYVVKTGEMVILLRFTTSWTRNPTEEWLFRRESLAHERGILQMNGYSSGNHQFREEDSTTEEWNFAKNYQLIDRESILLGTISSWTLIQDGKIKILRQSSEKVTISGSTTLKS
jgi:hypothetical protein